MQPFSLAWFGFLLVAVVVGIGLYRLLRHRSRTTRRLVLAVVAAANVVLYTAFTFNSILDPAWPEVTLAQNLPFHLCNLVAWGLIPAYLFDWPPADAECPAAPIGHPLLSGLRGQPLPPSQQVWWAGVSERLRAFCFFVGTLTGFLTLTSPVPIYIGRPIFSLPTLGFYGVHSMNAVLSVLLATLGLYRPSYRQAGRAVVHLILLATLILPLDLVMRWLIDPKTNYFYLFDPEGAGILIWLHSLLPVPYVYMLLATPLALGGCLAVNFLYQRIGKLVERYS